MQPSHDSPDHHRLELRRVQRGIHRDRSGPDVAIGMSARGGVQRAYSLSLLIALAERGQIRQGLAVP